MKKNLLWLVAIPLIAIGWLTYADDAFLQKEPVNEYIKYSYDTDDGKNIPVITVYWTWIDWKMYGVTIKATNEWTTTAGTGNESYWYYFQWWNNHWNNWTSETTWNLLPIDDLASWANKWYNWTETKFIKAANSYYDYRNGLRNYSNVTAIQHSLRWWSWDNETIDWVVKWYNTGTHQVTNLAWRQWPCESWYHVPSAWEWQELVKLYAKANRYNLNTQNNENAWANTISEGTAFSNDLLLPLAGYRDYNAGKVYDTGGYAHYWSSSPRGGSNPYGAWDLSFGSSNVYPSTTRFRANGQSVRCFKNSYIELPQTFNLYFMANTGDSIGQEIWSGTVTDNTTWATIAAQVSANVSKTGYVLEYRYWSGADSVAGFDFTGTAITWWMADEDGNVYFIAQWTPITYTISFSWNSENATWTAPATINAEYDSGDIAPDNTFTMTGYTFTGWNTETDGTGTWYATWDTLINLTTTSGLDVVLYAQWEVNVHKLNFVVDWTTIQSGDVAYSGAISAPAEPKKDCNSFAGWTSSVSWLTTSGTMPDSDVTFTANWNYTCSRSSWWWGRSRSSSVISNDSEKSTDSQTWSKVDSSAEASEWQDNTQDSSVDSQNNSNTQQKTYSEEFQKAYTFAKEKSITTMDTIEDANMEKPLTRIAMAKMLSYYAINVLNKKPDTDRMNKFSDVSDELDAQYDHGVTLAYQLWIMWINMKNNRFRPYDLVTRAEFATALSRLLFDTPDGEDVYYSTHLEKLLEEKIITNDDPALQELRGYVMIMLMRSAM